VDWWEKLLFPASLGSCLICHPVIDLRAYPDVSEYRYTLEARPATALEYLRRWLDANEVFNDDARLVSVVEWADGQLSFGITQPEYVGEPASDREIEDYFQKAGWKWITDPTRGGHLLFFQYTWGLLAYDAAPRNCFVSNHELQPFDVILCRPDDEMAEFLCLY
jgi:hypothetical protein